MTSPFDQPQCIITGAYLTDGSATIHGDLHQFGDFFIFNAVLGEEGEASRVYAPPPKSPAKVVSCENAFFFERRGIIIFPKRFAVLNQAAKDYLNV